MTNDVALVPATPPANSRYGIFDWLDHRSVYNQDFFPTPLLTDDTGLEPDGELELNSLHTGARDQRTDIASAELQKSFGPLTLEIVVPYEFDSDADDASRGFGSLEFGARCPVYQFVSAKGFFDNTLGVGLEVGVPVDSAISKNTELQPTVFNDLKVGDHFSLQTALGYSTLFGGGDDGGLQSLEYDFDFAWTFSHQELPVPGVASFTPMFELAGETGLNKDEKGQSTLLGSIGFRLALKPIGDLQPTIGLGYVFPINEGARSEVHWGIASSLIFEF